jgi:peptidoglycan hydrolase-like protein with peptidoglycan-binding domain
MDKPRLMAVVAGAVLTVSLSACQGMMGGRESHQQTSSAPSASAGTAAAQQAASSDLVRDVQRSLATRGYDVGPQDGVYGSSTEQALRRFQQDQRLNASGQIDGQTLAALGVMGGANQRASAGTAPGYSSSSGSSSREYVPTSRRQGAMATEPRASSRVSLAPDRVRDIQQNLADRGYNPGSVDGRWGSRTQTALRNFQRDQNMQASGRPDAQTLAALGVESGAPATQTGQLPADRNAVPPAENPSSVDLYQRDVARPEQQQGLLPPTGSQAPGAARETERSTLNPGGAPDTRPTPPEEQR